MNSKGLVLLTIAVVAIGILGLPSTVSLFSGQHAWYNLSPKGNDVPCEKCHADIVAEMDALVGPHTGETGYGRFECEYCHRIFEIYTYASGYGTSAKPGKEAHAASTIPCMHCHSGKVAQHGEVSKEDCLKCHDAVYPPTFEAGGFGLVGPPQVPGDTGSNAAHKAFVMDAINNSDMEDANEACIACHTYVPVKINWTHACSLEFNATYESEWVLPPTHFNTSKYIANGTVTVTSYGNYSGGANMGDWPEGNVTIWG
jgi:hypothetical protein